VGNGMVVTYYEDDNDDYRVVHHRLSLCSLVVCRHWLVRGPASGMKNKKMGEGSRRTHLNN
jgi:hypothetical protein